jgi:hypothetical protein
MSPYLHLFMSYMYGSFYESHTESSPFSHGVTGQPTKSVIRTSLRERNTRVFKIHGPGSAKCYEILNTERIINYIVSGGWNRGESGESDITKDS